MAENKPQAWDKLPDGSVVPCEPTNQQVALTLDIFHSVEVPC